MRSGRKKKKNIFSRLFLNPKFACLVGVVVLVWLLVPLSEKWEEKKEIDREIDRLQQEISQLENKNQNLEELTEYLRSDQFVEDQARSNLGLKKEGEEVIVMQKGEGKVAGAFDDNSEEGAGENGSGRDKGSSNIGKWLEYFFGKNKTSE